MAHQMQHPLPTYVQCPWRRRTPNDAPYIWATQSIEAAQSMVRSYNCISWRRLRASVRYLIFYLVSLWPPLSEVRGSLPHFHYWGFIICGSVSQRLACYILSLPRSSSSSGPALTSTARPGCCQQSYTPRVLTNLPSSASLILHAAAPVFVYLAHRYFVPCTSELANSALRKLPQNQYNRTYTGINSVQSSDESKVLHCPTFETFLLPHTTPQFPLKPDNHMHNGSHSYPRYPSRPSAPVEESRTGLDA